MFTPCSDAQTSDTSRQMCVQLLLLFIFTLLVSVDVCERRQDSGAELRHPENRGQTEVWI